MRIFFYLIVIVFLLVYPQDTAHAARDALIVWGESVVPLLFPYMLFCRTLFDSLRRISIPMHAVAAALGIMGGSPSGAAALTSCSGAVPKRVFFSLCALTGTVSPMFILGSVRSWTGDPPLCAKLLLSHWAGAILCAAAVFVWYRKETVFCAPCAQSHSTHATPLSQSIDAIFQVGGCIIGYSVISEILKILLRSLPVLHPVIHAALEMSGGIHAICKSKMLPDQRSILLAAVLGFSGISILSQNHAFLKHAGVSMHQLTVFALLRMLISAGVMALML